MSNIEISFEPHYLANLIGSLFVSVNISDGLELNSKDMFGSSKWFQKLSSMYLNWVNYTGFTIPLEYSQKILRSMGLMVPLMNLVCGFIEPEDTDLNNLQKLFKNFFNEINRFNQEKKFIEDSWSIHLVDFYLRKGKTDWNVIEEIMNDIFPIIEWYHSSFYKNFWIEKELSYYGPYVKTYIDRENYDKVLESTSLLQQWVKNKSKPLELKIFLNRFMSSFNDSITYEMAKALAPHNKIVTSPQFDLEGITHEIAHVIQGYQSVYSNLNMMRRIATEIVPYCGISESPINLWTLREVIQMELEEIITDYLSGQAVSRVDPSLEIKCSYCKAEPFLTPLYNRLQNYNDLLGKVPFLEFLSKVFNNWTYKPIN